MITDKAKQAAQALDQTRGEQAEEWKFAERTGLCPVCAEAVVYRRVGNKDIYACGACKWERKRKHDA